MSQSLFTHRLETAGYITLPRPHPDSPGFGGLLVLLRQQPQGHEPDRLDLRLHLWDGQATLSHLHADTQQLFSNAVCPGRVVVGDRQGEEKTFYTFGGSLESDTQNGETIYSLRSSAPVLELQPQQETPADLLADEAEALFARVRAGSGLSSAELLDGLVRAGSEAVYQALIQSLLPGEAGSVAREYSHPELVALLTREKAWYRATGRWSLLPRTLNELLDTVLKA